MNWLKSKKKGISPVIAIVQMIALAIAIAFIIYAWTTGFVSEKVGGVRVEAEYVVLESQSLSGGTLTMVLRNSSDAEIVIDSIYVNGVLAFTSMNLHMEEDEVISLSITLAVALPAAHPISEGDEITLVTQRGIAIEFKVRN